MAKSASTSASKPAYRRVIVKVSGEALSGPEGFGVCREVGGCFSSARHDLVPHTVLESRP